MYPSIHFLYLLLLSVSWEAGVSPAVTVGEVGDTLDRLKVHHRVDQGKRKCVNIWILSVWFKRVWAIQCLTFSLPLSLPPSGYIWSVRRTTSSFTLWHAQAPRSIWQPAPWSSASQMPHRPAQAACRLLSAACRALSSCRTAAWKRKLKFR